MNAGDGGSQDGNNLASISECLVGLCATYPSFLPQIRNGESAIFVISCGDSGGTITNLESGTYTGEFTLFYDTGGSQLTNTATFNIRVSP